MGYGDYLLYSEKIAKLVEMDAHFITWGPVLEGQPGHFIGCDNVTGAYLMTKHLIDLGYKKIAFLGGVSEQAPEFQARYQGYVKALLEAKLIVNPNLQIDAETSEAAGYQAANTLLSAKYRFDAVFGASDLISIGAVRALREKQPVSYTHLTLPTILLV